MRKLPSPIRLLKERYFGEAARNPSVARKALADLSSRLPPQVVPIASKAVEELIEYQDPDYALLYLDRLSRYVAPTKIGAGIFAELARLLSDRMQYEDPIVIARAKLAEAGGMKATPDPASADRIERFRWYEILVMLPPSAAAPAMNVFARLRLMQLANRSVNLRFSAASKFALLRLKFLSALRVARPFSQRCKIEKAWVERWLHMIDRSLLIQLDAAAGIVATAEIIKGHGDPYHEGIGKWHVIVDGLVKPTCDGTLPLRTLADAVKEARLAALETSGEVGVRTAVETLRMQCLGRT